LILKIC